MLFITILYDTDIASPNEKAKLMLEIYGNTELRASTFAYLIKKSNELRQIVVHEANKEEGEENRFTPIWPKENLSNQEKYLD